jgi:hypothetical protein
MSESTSGWSREFDESIALPGGRKLVCLRDAANYITALPKNESALHDWQAAIEALMLVADLGGQRAAPVVVPEGPAAGSGVWSSAVDPGVPLGPGLLATCVVFHGPHVRIATARINATAITANLRRKLIEPSRS